MNKKYYLIIFIGLIVINITFIMLVKPILFIFSFIALCIYLVYIIVKLFQFLKLSLKKKNEVTLKSMFLKPIDIYNYNEYLVPKIKKVLEDLADRFTVTDGCFIYDGDAVTIKTNIKEYKQFAIAYYTKYPVLFHMHENDNSRSINTDFRSEVTFKYIEKIDNIEITANALESSHKGNIITISKNKANALDCLFVNNITYGILINNNYMKFFNKEIGFNIDLMNKNTDYNYVSFYDMQVLRYFYKILNEYDANLEECTAKNKNTSKNNLEYLNNIIKKEESAYTYPIIEEDYKKRIEYINNIISNIENKIYTAEPFIQKEVYKIDYQNELNEKQLLAVQTINGALLIIAGAGTGKTKTLCYRTAYMLENGINPSEILLLTFTKKAAKEMLNRTQELLGLKTITIQGGTFHSFANNVLRQYSKILNIKADFTILDTADSEDVIDLVRRELKLEKTAGKPMPKKSAIQKIISMSKNFRKSVQDIIYLKYPNLQDFIPSIELIYNSYIEYNKAHNLLDYDDLLEQLYLYLKNNKQFKDILQNRYKYIMADEFQDTNIIQKLIINELADKYQNVMAVGDDAQSIYSFRGASFENILIFPEAYPDCKIIKLEKNYRSSQPILDFTNDIINNFSIGYKKQLFTDKKNTVLPVIKRFGDAEAEAEYIKNEIINLYNNGISYKNTAVLFRSSYHSNFIQTSLTLAGIPYKVFGGIKFIERRHVRDIISYLRILQNPLDAVAWNRVLLLLDNIGSVSSSKIIKAIENNNGRIDFSSFNKTKYYNQLLILENILNTNNKADIPISLKIENIKKYYAPILENKENDADKRLLDIDVLITMSNKYNYDLEKFLTDFALEPPENQFQDNVQPTADSKDYITLSTIHSAKGLEWENVFIIHTIDGLFPSSYSIENIESLEEERRLFYVASTRVKAKLYLTMPAYSHTYNGYLELPSRFITEIEESKYITEN